MTPGHFSYSPSFLSLPPFAEIFQSFSGAGDAGTSDPRPTSSHHKHGSAVHPPLSQGSLIPSLVILMDCSLSQSWQKHLLPIPPPPPLCRCTLASTALMWPSACATRSVTSTGQRSPSMLPTAASWGPAATRIWPIAITESRKQVNHKNGSQLG